ncbi:MAG: type II toxin-antitoxin system RelE/ParE family toxin [Acidobacteriota bacterium]
MPESPARTVRVVPRFLKSKRRLSPRVQGEVDAQVRKLTANPFEGEPKTGALKGVQGVKFKVEVQQYLLAYLFFSKPNVIELLDVGMHESFYRDLQNYLDAR